MQDTNRSGATGWTVETSQAFIDYGRYFVPDREAHMQIMADVIVPLDEPFHVIDLCCGAGLLSATLLERFPQAIVHGLDGAPEMLDRASTQLAQFGDRFNTQQIAIADRSWRSPAFSVQAVVSSLAIHHLDDAGKQQLFADVFGMLNRGGVFVIADVVRPATDRGWQVAADAWDEAVRERSLRFDGNTDALATFERERWNMYRYFDPNDIDQPSRLVDQLRWLEAVGFQDVDVYYMRAGHAVFGGVR